MIAVSPHALSLIHYLFLSCSPILCQYVVSLGSIFAIWENSLLRTKLTYFSAFPQMTSLLKGCIVSTITRFLIYAIFLLQGVCIFVSVLLHYFYLVAFDWMLVEGLLLYFKVVKVFNIHTKLTLFYIYSWGK